MRTTFLFIFTLAFTSSSGEIAPISEAAKSSVLTDCASTLCARREAVNSVVARLRVTLRDRAKDKSYDLSGAYIGDAAGNLRLRVTTEAGQLVLDMGVRGEKVDIC